MTIDRTRGVLAASAIRRFNISDVHDCVVWHASVPPDGWIVEGPAIVEFTGQSVVVPPGALGTADKVGNLHVRLGP